MRRMAQAWPPADPDTHTSSPAAEVDVAPCKPAPVPLPDAAPRALARRCAMPRPADNPQHGLSTALACRPPSPVRRWARVAGKTFRVSWQRAAAAFRLASSAVSRSAQLIEVDSATNLEAHFTWSDHHGQYWQEMCSKAFVWLRAFNALRNNIISYSISLKIMTVEFWG